MKIEADFAVASSQIDTAESDLEGELYSSQKYNWLLGLAVLFFHRFISCCNFAITFGGIFDEDRSRDAGRFRPRMLSD
jgi:hypothetical protein